MTSPLALSNLIIAHGSHVSRKDGMCLLEAVAWFAGEPHSDSPKCVDTTLRSYGIRLNDRLKNDERQQLRDLIPALVGTAGSHELSMLRAFLLVDRSVRLIVPLALEACGLVVEAKRLRELGEIVDHSSAALAREVTREVRVAAYAADAADAAAAAAAAADDAAADAAAAYADAAAAAYAAAAAADAAAAYAAAAAAYAAAAASAASERLVGWLSDLIDEYDRLSGRTSHREVTSDDLRVLAEAVAR